MKIKFEDCTDYDTGVKYLEQEFGEQWFNKIDTCILDMFSIHKCIIGQLSEKGYKDYVENIGLDFGFYCDNESNVFSSYYKEYSLLMHRHNWKGIINLKRALLNNEYVSLFDYTAEKIQKNLLSDNQNQKYLLTFESGSCMILTSLKDAPEGQKFTYEII